MIYPEALTELVIYSANIISLKYLIYLSLHLLPSLIRAPEVVCLGFLELIPLASEET